MFSIILAISLIASPDTIYPVRNYQGSMDKSVMSNGQRKEQEFSNGVITRSTQNISYRVFVNDSNLYFQYQINKNWSAPKVIDEKVSEYAMTLSSGDYVHIAWCKDGKVYYKTNQLPLTRKDTIRWECNIAISPNFTEPASNISIYTKNDYIYVNWQTPLEGNPNQVEKWRRTRWLEDTPFEWETPECLSEPR